MQVFYNTQKLSLKQKKEICHEAKERSYKWWADKLDCNISWQRQKIEMPFEEILSKINSASHFVIIQRDDIIDGIYLEIGFSTMVGEPSYFLWIMCDVENSEFFIDKYKLMPCQ